LDVCNEGIKVKKEKKPPIDSGSARGVSEGVGF
jgi:hypothetical protein